MALHDNGFPIDDGLVWDLVRTQAPHWSSQPLRRLDTSGTVNVVGRPTARYPTQDLLIGHGVRRLKYWGDDSVASGDQHTDQDSAG